MLVVVFVIVPTKLVYKTAFGLNNDNQYLAKLCVTSKSRS